LFWLDVNPSPPLPIDFALSLFVLEQLPNLLLAGRDSEAFGGGCRPAGMVEWIHAK
jgi:hypothetical protein